MAGEAIKTAQALAFLTATSVVTSFAQAGTADVVAAPPIGAVAGLTAVLPIFANGAVLTAPSWGWGEKRERDRAKDKNGASGKGTKPEQLLNNL